MRVRGHVLFEGEPSNIHYGAVDTRAVLTIRRDLIVT